MDEKEVLALLQKYLTNQCTAQEIAIVESHFLHLINNGKTPEGEIDYDRIEREIWANISPTPVRRRLPAIARYAAIITVVACAAGGIYYASHQKPNIQHQTVSAKQIQPAGNNATLTLSNGQTIALNTQSGLVGNHSLTGVSISNNVNSGTVTFSQDSKTTQTSHIKEAEGPNTIATPRGGQYQLVLSDGTRVYLNASSTLTFPALFSEKAREVSITGEAYFEVARDPRKPFLVTTKGQQLKVLGTHFNVSAYPNEQLKTTLAEGSVELTSSSLQKQLLKPGQQALLLSAGDFQVHNVDAEDAIAWHSGYFLFRETPLPEAIRQICRWYNVDADIQNLPLTPVNAMLPNNLTLSDFINGLEFSNGIKITLTEERRLIINRK